MASYFVAAAAIVRPAGSGSGSRTVCKGIRFFFTFWRKRVILRAGNGGAGRVARPIRAVAERSRLLSDPGWRPQDPQNSKGSARASHKEKKKWMAGEGLTG